MILDSLDNIGRYRGVVPSLDKVIEFFEKTDFQTLKPGRIVLDDDRLFINVQYIDPKSREQAPLERHVDYIDIQVPVSADEEMGFTPDVGLAPASVPYDKTADVAFHPGLSDTYLQVRKGMFTVFFPGEGHAPGITPGGVLKFIVKIKA